ncbi:hypothetical protein [Pseudomonas nitroreducens]|uniref:hypothetical protein n=1 Tax=Pseudomonas nitroreducens TaxID=46680 RepID=UPI003CC82C4D
MLTCETSAGWRPARRPGDPVSRSGWDALAERDLAGVAGWGKGSHLQADLVGAWDALAEADQGAASSWSRGAPEDAVTGSTWNTVARKDLAAWLGWDRSIRAQDTRLRLIYNPRPAIKDTAAGQVWQRSDELGARFDAEQERRASLYVPGAGGGVSFSFGGARYTPSSSPLAFFNFKYTPKARAIQPVDSMVSVGFSPARVLEQLLGLPWGRGTPTDGEPTGIVYPDYPGPVVVVDPPEEPDILETYMIANTVTLTVLPSGAVLDASNISIGLDADSFAWSFSADLFGRTSMNLVRQDANGPKTIELTINGWVWRFLVDSWSSTAKHPAERYSIKGSSRTKLLADPYAPKRSGMNTAQLNARQVIDEQLYNTGFSASWDTVAMGPPDWTLPAGAFSYLDQTPMQVITRVAEVVGGVVRPDMASDGLSILPRYREATWYWDTAIPDRIIPAEIVAEAGGEWSPQPEWNYVYVSGTNYGMGVQVRRAGTAGDVMAPDVLDDWMTGTDAARSRGICELSKGGLQSIETRRIPLMENGGSAPGLVLPAMLVEVRDPEQTWRGLCLGVDISASGTGASKVWQTLRIERHYQGGE